MAMVKNGLGSNEGTAWCGKTSEKNPHVGRPAAGFEPLELRMQSGDATLLATMLENPRVQKKRDKWRAASRRSLVSQTIVKSLVLVPPSPSDEQTVPTYLDFIVERLPSTVAKRLARHFTFGRSRVLTPVPPDQVWVFFKGFPTPSHPAMSHITDKANAGIFLPRNPIKSADFCPSMYQKDEDCQNPSPGVHLPFGKLPVSSSGEEKPPLESWAAQDQDMDTNYKISDYPSLILI
ncbi:hypothetical protein GEV33_008074 [Tenebrio molitor]|uniref:Uncharacterized protein n=1 Tax=Tenebrio molitor TaxID=7067 RepID=A0A8J6LBS6_TENMO|nr:hypothetical protein GEV33_008074 [Tenebrio molitor]